MSYCRYDIIIVERTDKVFQQLNISLKEALLHFAMVLLREMRVL
jgi:hypothetical protein|nr:MAG TPA: hypothetical protein [Bacteriophage sp.]